MNLIYETSAASAYGDQWSAVLLQGAPGIGKSDLALRLIGDRAWPIANDQFVLATVGGEVIAGATEPCWRFHPANVIDPSENSAPAKLRLAADPARRGILALNI